MVVHIFQPARQTMNVNESDTPNATKASAGVASSGDEGNEELSDAISMSFPQKVSSSVRRSTWYNVFRLPFLGHSLAHCFFVDYRVY